MMKIAWVAVLGLIACSGAALIEDDMQSYAEFSSPDGLNGWTVTGATANQWVKASPRNDQDGNSNQALRIKDTDTGDSASVLLKGDLSGVSQNITINFDLQLFTASQNPTLWLQANRGIMLNFASATTGDLQYNGSSGWVKLSDPLKLGNVNGLQAWYSFQISIPQLTGTAADTWDLTVLDYQGATVVQQTGLTFRVPMSSLDTMDFGFNTVAGSANGDMFIDNVTVIPEPASISMLLVGCAGLLLLRRRIKA